MIKSTFEKLAEEENGQFHEQNKKYYGRGMSHAPVSKYLLKVVYRDQEVSVLYELGNYNLAKVECILSSGLGVPEFRIKTKGQFWLIFNKTKDKFEIECENSNFKEWLLNRLKILGLDRISRDSLFEPKIFGRKEEGGFEIVTKYHLEFSNKENVIRPLIEFYKALIDYALQI